jgi:hypothetical protein
MAGPHQTHRQRRSTNHVACQGPRLRRPGCDAPGYRCEIRHLDEWAQGGLTNIDKLTQACPPDHKLLDERWGVRTRADGTTEWIPSPQLPHAGGDINTYHHPERLIDNDHDNDAA